MTKRTSKKSSNYTASRAASSFAGIILILSAVLSVALILLVNIHSILVLGLIAIILLVIIIKSKVPGTKQFEIA